MRKLLTLLSTFRDRQSISGLSSESKSSDVDIAVLTSDKAEINIPSYMLQANSAVFRDLLGDPSFSSAPKPIPIDAFSADLKCFLNFMYQAHVPLPKSWTQAEIFLDLCEKYECEIIKERLMQALRSFSPKKPWEAFYFASHHDDILLARHALQCLGSDKKRKNAISSDISLEEASKVTLPYLLGYFVLCNMLEPPLVWKSGLIEKDWNYWGDNLRLGGS
ncbi:hypothetical protein I302_100120 [Kwoniella bestiolae CBS 10118]|uniref:BTB domain-containing protein n=1 Tax=Kwoniella bestiolae CBS 10118 TaxID=1296100 RepID=A0A1B9G482_9TREE|nr:hypothetical protein I302_03497 [Kwoniella bestiolae CBS 10118]OCF25823.1 hypothetical protein I302_03497 [Kwoniella bestiolae CBS 10118]